MARSVRRSQARAAGPPHSGQLAPGCLVGMQAEGRAGQLLPEEASARPTECARHIADHWEREKRNGGPASHGMKSPAGERCTGARATAGDARDRSLRSPGGAQGGRPGPPARTPCSPRPPPIVGGGAPPLLEAAPLTPSFAAPREGCPTRGWPGGSAPSALTGGAPGSLPRGVGSCAPLSPRFTRCSPRVANPLTAGPRGTSSSHSSLGLAGLDGPRGPRGHAHPGPSCCAADPPHHLLRSACGSGAGLRPLVLRFPFLLCFSLA